MRTSFSSVTTLPAKTDALVIGVASSGALPAGLGYTRAELSAIGFDGRCCQTTVIPATAKSPVRVLVGLGEMNALTANTMRLVGAAAARASARYARVATTLVSDAR